MDYTSERSSHVGAIPRTGGIAIVITFCVGVLLYYYFQNKYFVGQHAFWGLFVSALIIALVSFYDDITNRAFIFKFLSQFIGVAILLGFGLTLNEWSVPFIGKVSFGAYRYVLTFLWVIGLTNAFNFMDGLNGLACGVAVIVSIAFAFITLSFGSGVTFHMSYIITAACLGFFFFNFSKASIFMGDVGSTFLGFCFGAMAILAAHYDAHHTSFMAIPILLANFIMETLFTFVWRLFKRQPVLKPHRIHPYQLLNQMGVSATVVSLIYFAQSIVLALLCFFYMYSSINVRVIIIMSMVGLYLCYFIKVHQFATAKGILSQ